MPSLRLEGLAFAWSDAVPLLDLLVEHPVVTVKYVVEQVGGTPTTIGALLDKLVAMRIIEEITGHKRNRIYRYSPFLDLFTSEDRPRNSTRSPPPQVSRWADCTRWSRCTRRSSIAHSTNCSWTWHC